jgi:hypothetical protein
MLICSTNSIIYIALEKSMLQYLRVVRFDKKYGEKTLSGMYGYLLESTPFLIMRPSSNLKILVQLNS